MKIISNEEYDKLINDKTPTIEYYMNNPYQARKIEKLEDYNTELEIKIDKKDKEIERLKQGYCELKEKCNKGECDCIHEEYNNMCEQNIKLMNRIDKAIEYIENVRIYGLRSGKTLIATLLNDVLDILKGSDKE